MACPLSPVCRRPFHGPSRVCYEGGRDSDDIIQFLLFHYAFVVRKMYFAHAYIITPTINCGWDYLPTFVVIYDDNLRDWTGYIVKIIPYSIGLYSSFIYNCKVRLSCFTYDCVIDNNDIDIILNPKGLRGSHRTLHVSVPEYCGHFEWMSCCMIPRSLRRRPSEALCNLGNIDKLVYFWVSHAFVELNVYH